MPNYELRTQILSPEEEKTFSFTCPHPSRFFKIIPQLLQNTFEVTTSHLFEDKIKWDVGDTSVQFFGWWRVDEGKDRRSRILAQIKFQGSQELKGEMKGNATIFLTAFLTTRFPYTNVLEQGIYKIYTYLLYNKQRRFYIEQAKNRLQHIENEIRRNIGLMV